MYPTVGISLQYLVFFKPLLTVWLYVHGKGKKLGTSNIPFQRSSNCWLPNQAHNLCYHGRLDQAPMVLSAGPRPAGGGDDGQPMYTYRMLLGLTKLCMCASMHASVGACLCYEVPE